MLKMTPKLLLVAGIVAALSISLKVNFSNIVQAQTRAAISSPASGSSVEGTVAIMGTAAIEDFQRYELYYKPEPSSDDSYIYFGGNTRQVFNGQLGVWQTADLRPGTYALRLRVVKQDGHYSEHFVANLSINEQTATPTPLATELIPFDFSQPERIKQPTSVTIEGGSNAELRKLLRWYVTATAPFEGKIDEINVLVGSLPAELPIDLELPEQTAVVGSVVSRGGQGSIEILLETIQPEEAVLDMLRGQLIDQALDPTSRYPEETDTMATRLAAIQSNHFCGDGGDFIVGLQSYNTGEQTTNGVLIQMNFVEGYNYVCQPSPFPELTQLHELTPPPAAAVMMQSGSLEPTSKIYEVDGEINGVGLSMAEIIDHYAEQLEALGWQQLDAAQIDGLARSTWTLQLEGNLWLLTFDVVRSPLDPESYQLMFVAQQQGQP